MVIRLLLCAFLLIPWPTPAYQYAFPPEPLPVELSDEQNSTLERTGMVKGLQQDDNRGEAWLVMDLEIEPDRLWAVILAFQRYSDRVESMESSRLVKQDVLDDHQLIWVDYELARFWVSLNYRLVHEYWPAKSYLRWTLDPEHKNDLDSVDGYWHLQPHPTRPGWSRVYYGARLTAFDWLPNWVQNLLAQDGLDTTSHWLKGAVNDQNPL